MCTETSCTTGGSAGTGLGRRALLGAALATPAALLAPAAVARAAGTQAASLPRLLVFTRTTGFRRVRELRLRLLAAGVTSAA